MEFIWKLSRCFIIIVYTLQAHAATPKLKIEVDCMRQEEPYCCRVNCSWKDEAVKHFTKATCDVKGENMECNLNTGEQKWITTTPLIPEGTINSEATCVIRSSPTADVYDVFCFHEKKPICCKTPCEWNLDFLNATCTMNEREISCSHGAGGNLKEMGLCFQDTFCPHKPDDKTCDFGGSDMCYIYTETADLIGQEQGPNFKEQMMDNENGTVKGTSVLCCNAGGIIFYIFIGIIIGGPLGCLFMKMYINRQGLGNAHRNQADPGNAHGDQAGPGIAHGDQADPRNVRGDQAGPGNAHGDQADPRNDRGDQAGPGIAHGDQAGPRNVHEDQADGRQEMRRIVDGVKYSELRQKEEES